MSIQEHLNKIRNAIYGREVRESIAKGIETAYDDASEKDNANMEVKIARGTHPNLRSRLEEVDDKQQQTTTQLAQKAKKTEVRENTDTRPINVSEMDSETKQLFTGGAVAVVGEKAVGNENLKPKAVTADKTDFLRVNKTTLNQDDSETLSGFINPTNGILQSSGQGAFVYLVPLEIDNKYKLTSDVHADWDTTRVAIYRGKPIIGYSPYQLVTLDHTQSDVEFNTVNFPKSTVSYYLAIQLSTIGAPNNFELTGMANYLTLEENVGVMSKEGFIQFQEKLNGRNLALNSDRPLTTSSNYVTIGLTEPLLYEETYTLTFEALAGEGVNSFNIYSGAKPLDVHVSTNETGKYQTTFTVNRSDLDNPTTLRIYQNPLGLTTQSTIQSYKLENNRNATPYTKAPEDLPTITQKNIIEFISIMWGGQEQSDDRIYVESFRYGNKSDSEIIQEAFDNANNDIVVFGSGREYTIDTTVIARGSKVKGIEGNNATLLGNVEAGYTIEYVGSKTSGSASPRSLSEQQFKELNSYIRDLRITSSTNYISNGLRVTGFVGFNFENIHIFRTYDGLTIDGRVRNLNIIGSNFYDNANTGIMFDKVSLHQINIGTTHVSYNKNGIRFIDGDIANVQITGCDLENGRGGGFDVPDSILSFEWSGDVNVYPIYEAIVITGNTIQEHMSNSKPTININSRPGQNQDVIISSNLIGNSGVESVPIYVNNAEGLSISDNNIVSSDLTPDFINSIMLEGSIRWSRINGNTLERPIKHDGATITHTLVSNNVCRNFEMPDGNIGGVRYLNNVY